MVGVLTGGVLAAVYTVWHGLKQKSWPNWFYVATFLIGGYFFSSYQAWEDQVNTVNTIQTNFNAGIPTVSTAFVSKDNSTNPPLDMLTIVFSKEYVHPYFLIVGNAPFSIMSKTAIIDDGIRNIAPNVVLVQYDSPSIAAGEPVQFDITNSGFFDRPLQITGIFALLLPYQND
jgi:hypothetical protein